MLGWLHRTFGTLRWKLAASYVLVTLLVVLLLEAVLLVVGLGLFTYFYPTITSFITSDIAQQTAPILADASLTREELAARFMTVSQGEANPGPDIRVTFSSPETEAGTQPDIDGSQLRVFSVLLDREGQVLATVPDASVPDGAPVADPASIVTQPIVAAALRGITDTAQLTSWTQDNAGYMLAAAPVLDDTGEVQGAVYARFPPPPLVELVTGFAAILGVSAVALLVSSGFIGLIFGLVAGRGLSRRLKRLTAASAAMAEGDLSRRIDDWAADEIGQLGRQFNTMAEQLAENMRALRLLADQNARLAEQATQLATVEERNRLARDLHDSVSQELFSLSMQAAAAQRLVQANPDQAATQLHEIQATAQQALQETRSLIFALRPAQLDGRGLAPALRDLQSAVRERQGLEVDLSVQGERRVPLEHEQALFRIVQEALANVVRHSGAHRAEIDLDYADDKVCLTVRDQGHGFETAMPRNPGSLGLFSMQERAAALGGTLHIDSAPDRGTSVHVCLPVPSFQGEPHRRIDAEKVSS